ncbi:MAG: tRNA 2-thiouridine(34) synthase MnmA, partial [Syntrophomonadaceae bacterium]|nr:tRNA 2-thiouridine(34) synthase MnmA [Syntrophomonadaceae bacterium]
DEKESQEICFIPGDYRDFLSARISSIPGDIIDKQGSIIGKHKGLAYYTIGQRHGLGVNAGKKVYVIEIDVVKNLLVVDEEDYLFSCELMAGQNNFISIKSLQAPMNVEAKIRYAAAPASAIITPVSDKVKVLFEQPQRAITPGQSVVYYQNETVIGGGRII